MAENSFQIWDDVIHTMPDQMKRIASAKKAATSPNSIDKENKTGVFEGSGKEPYHVTLESCTCGDFKRRKLPCKHMYRLAMELGEFGGDFTEGTNKNVVSHGQIKFEEAVDEIEKLPEAAQRDLQHVFSGIQARSMSTPAKLTMCQKPLSHAQSLRSKKPHLLNA